MQVLFGALALLQTMGHTHPLEHLNVVVNLKRVVEVEQVFIPEKKC